ncbi:hypothetical protein AXG93_285s1110 [Marchantia polymorpha subsp. ruderalis]|uniref:PB1 domain-containing protein n=1 Tax=Marchantia polymorpha subsp. ruderalis TaxID=1480154 RepID=A0A176VRC7_MARPO|nr:hypothetical protein AXG93_285s1110 [Marchantia polymorpha subsp. ruderalis]
MSGTNIKMEKSEESMGGGGKGWGGGRDRDSSSDGGGGSGENTGLDPQLWHACAGGMVQLPPVGAKGTIGCRVVSPLEREAAMSIADSTLDADGGPSSPPPEKPASFAKTLTQSDANNGGGFSVPRYCAETIFPPLDYSIDPPVQTVLAKDKKLVAGDAIVFLRTASGELCVGVRSAAGGGSVSSAGSAAGPGGPRAGPGGSNSGPGIGIPGPSTTSSFARNRARVTAQSVLEAASLAVQGQPFEVVYYPRASTAEFCVKAQAVKAALDHTWFPGMRFKMAFETEDSSRISWFMGTISAVQPADSLWPKSPWRVLQVTWDEPDLLQGVSRVSPWQVELVSTLPMQLPPFSLPKKKLRAAQPSDMNMQGQGLMGMPITLPSVFGQINPWAHGLTMEEVTAGMQGARHDRVFGLALSEKFRPGKLPGGFFSAAEGYYPDHAGRGGGGEPHLSAFPLQDRASNISSLISSLGSVPPSGDHGSAGALLVPAGSWSGGSANNKSASTQLVLFGQAINTDSNKSQPQHSGGSSCDGPSLQHLKEESSGKRKDSPSESNQNENFERGQKYMSGSLSNGKQSDLIVGEFQKWVPGLDKERGAGEKLAASPGESFSHCKVFKENDEVGRTVDLSQFSSYEELYDRLGAMFGLEQKVPLNAMFYRDGENYTRNVGCEPYRNFAKSARRLVIRVDPSSNGKTRSQ